MSAYGPPGGGAAALLDAVLSVGETPPGQDDNDERRAVLDVFLFSRIGGELPAAPLYCESCTRAPAGYVVIVPGAMRVAPFLVCAECRP